MQSEDEKCILYTEPLLLRTINIIVKIITITFKLGRIISKDKTKEEYFKSHFVTNKFTINKISELKEQISIIFI